MADFQRDNAFKQIAFFAPLTDEKHTKLDMYVNLLLKWNNSINLIGKTTVADIWSRHILDSAQLLKFIPKTAEIVTDLGSGAGLPGLILAILGIKQVHLIESNSKKAAFLAEAARITNTKVTIHNVRIEDATVFKSDIITARACAEVEKILKYAEPFMKKDSLCLLLKGCNVIDELEKSRKNWYFEKKLHPSIVIEEDTSQGFVIALSKIKSKLL